MEPTKAIARTTGIVPADQFRKNGFMPATVEYRSKGIAVKNIVGCSPEHSMFLNVIDQLPEHMGVREPLTEQQVLICTQFITEHFGHLNPQEIVRAFTLAAAGKLLAPIQISQENASSTQINAANEGQLVTVTAETFNKWSLPYVGKILKAYSEMRQRETLEWSKATEADRLKLDAAPISEMTGAEVLDAIIEFTEATNEIPMACRWDLVFKELEVRGEIVMTNEYKQQYLDEIIEVEMLPLQKLPERIKREKLLSLKNGLAKSLCQKALVITWALDKYPQSKYLLPISLPSVKLKP